MGKFEAFSLLFVDSFVSNIIIGFQHELIFHAMKMLGNYDFFIMLIVATYAALCGNVVNYIFGKCAFNIFYYSKNEQNILRYKNLAMLYHKYDIFILLLIAFPFWGCFVALFSGFFKIRFLKFLSVGCIAKACYYTLELYIL
ncbi:MAG: DedA family protein [Rickettsia endosymbiont of Pentastiridius leporinus]